MKRRGGIDGEEESEGLFVSGDFESFVHQDSSALIARLRSRRRPSSSFFPQEELIAEGTREKEQKHDRRFKRFDPLATSERDFTLYRCGYSEPALFYRNFADWKSLELGKFWIWSRARPFPGKQKATTSSA